MRTARMPADEFGDYDILHTMKPYRIFLFCVIGLFSLIALFGIAMLLLPNTSRQTGELMGSLFSILAAAIISLGAGFVMEKGIWRRPMQLAMIISGLAVLLLQGGIWTDYPLSESFAKPAVISYLWAVTLVHGGLMSLTRFKGILQNFRNAVIVTALALTTVCSVTIFMETRHEYFYRIFGILFILTALGTVALPILYKLYGLSPLDAVSTPMELQITCPRCLHAQTLLAGEGRCVQCRLRIKIEIEEPRCPKCNYLLYKLTMPRCPECGEALGTEELATEVAGPERSVQGGI